VRRLAVILALGLLACEPPQPAAPLPTECATAGTRCAISKGKIGLCVQAQDGSLTCASQH
jgi:hypothetical protein